MREAEIYLDTIFLLQFLMFQKQNVIVEGDRLHLGISLFHSAQSAIDGCHRHGEYFLQKILSHLPVAQGEDHPFAAFPRDNEVTFHVAETPSLVDFAWSFGDHAFVQDMFSCRLPAVLLFEYFVSSLFDHAAIRTFDISSDGERRNVRQLLLNPLQSFCNLFRCLVIHQMMLDEFPEIGMHRDLFAFPPATAHADIREVLRIFSIIRSAFPLLLKFVPDPALGTVECIRNLLQ